MRTSVKSVKVVARTNIMTKDDLGKRVSTMAFMKKRGLKKVRFGNLSYRKPRLNNKFKTC